MAGPVSIVAPPSQTTKPLLSARSCSRILRGRADVRDIQIPGCEHVVGERAQEPLKLVLG